MSVPVFVDVRLPEYIEAGAQGGPGFNTTVKSLSSGDEKRNVNWEQAKCKYDISYGVKSPNDLRTIVAFFYARRGRAVGFRFKDWVDFFAFEQVIGTGDGTKTEFQLIKTYGDYVRTITKPAGGTIKIYINGIETTTGWSVNTSNGVVTFTAPVVDDAVVSANFEFDVPVRFDTDELGVSLHFVIPDETDSYGSIPSIPLVEVRK